MHFLFSAIVKIQRNQEALLTTAEKNLVRRFQVESNAEIVAEVVAELAGEGLDSRLKRKRQLSSAKTSDYINLDWIPPTSDIVERFFSKVKLVLTDLRKSLMPVTLESILFLKVHMRIWCTTKFVTKAIRRQLVINSDSDESSDDSSDEGIFGDHY
jgi:hypothetical protein